MGAKLFTAADADEYVKRALSSTDPTLWVFDFDDTLVTTDCMVRSIARDGTVTSLTPAQFAVHVLPEGDTYDFSDFMKLINPRPIDWMVRVLVRLQLHHGSESVAVLSARSSDEPIREFLSGLDMDDVVAHACKSADPRCKLEWVANRISEGRRVEFFDDSPKNAEIISTLPGAASYRVISP